MHVTVLMAVYNGGDALQAAVESIQEQSYPDWDLVVVDDASTDGTREVLRRLAAADSRIRCLCNSENMGLAASLNVGWRQARGPLIARMDHDDASLPGRLERQVAFLRRHEDVAVLGTGAELIAEDGTPLGDYYRPEMHAELAARVLRENPFIHPSVMMRKSFLVALGGYDERLPRAQDYDLWARGVHRFRYHNLTVPLVRYRVRTRLSWETLCSGWRVILRAGVRHGRPWSGLWYASRFLVAGALQRYRFRAGSQLRRAHHAS
jgi:glycosyltransferase involved in cell wall biosynthesis